MKNPSFGYAEEVDFPTLICLFVVIKSLKKSGLSVPFGFRFKSMETTNFFLLKHQSKGILHMHVKRTLLFFPFFS